MQKKDYHLKFKKNNGLIKMNYKITVKKLKKGYRLMIDFFKDTRDGHIVTYVVDLATKKEVKQWEIKNKEWLNMTSKYLSGV